MRAVSGKALDAKAEFRPRRTSSTSSAWLNALASEERMNETLPSVEDRVEEAIRRFVVEAIERRSTLSTAECVARIRCLHPDCALSEREIADEVIAAAAAAGIAVEIGSPAPA
jgi:aryl-alcohol dehydrogenase-like predicted oxidoreductase